MLTVDFTKMKYSQPESDKHTVSQIQILKSKRYLNVNVVVLNICIFGHCTSATGLACTVVDKSFANLATNLPDKKRIVHANTYFSMPFMDSTTTALVIYLWLCQVRLKLYKGKVKVFYNDREKYPLLLSAVKCK